MARFEARGDDLYIDGKKVVKAWESFSGWYWFATELVKGQSYNDKPIWFGFVQGFEEEWGTFTEAELESLGRMKVWPVKRVDLPHSGRRSN